MEEIELEPVIDYWLPEEFRAGLCTENEIGKPKGPIIEARRLAQRATPIAIKALVEVARDSDSSGARVKAANALLDRGWGRPDDNRVSPEAHAAGIRALQDEMPWISARRLMYQMGARVAEDIQAKGDVLPAGPSPRETAAEAPSAAAARSNSEAGSSVATDGKTALKPANSVASIKADIRRDYGQRGSSRK